MDEKFVTGNVVRLKSGGPPMTVTGENLRKQAWENTIDVCWFPEGAPKPEFSSFPASALRLERARRNPEALTRGRRRVRPRPADGA